MATTAYSDPTKPVLDVVAAFWPRAKLSPAKVEMLLSRIGADVTQLAQALRDHAAEAALDAKAPDWAAVERRMRGQKTREKYQSDAVAWIRRRWSTHVAKHGDDVDAAWMRELLGAEKAGNAPAAALEEWHWAMIDVTAWMFYNANLPSQRAGEVPAAVIELRAPQCERVLQCVDALPTFGMASRDAKTRVLRRLATDSAILGVRYRPISAEADVGAPLYDSPF